MERHPEGFRDPQPPAILLHPIGLHLLNGLAASLSRYVRPVRSVIAVLSCPVSIEGPRGAESLLAGRTDIVIVTLPHQAAFEAC